MMSINTILHNKRPQDTIVHIGPGVLYDEISYSRLKSHVVIAEPDPDQALILSSVTSFCRSAKVLAKAISPNDQPAQLHQYNNRTFNSLRKKTELKSLLPGLRQIGEIPVNVVPVAEFLEMLPAEHDSRDVLIIDSLGDELSLLETFDSQSGLARFSDIIVRSTRQIVFENGVREKTVSEWLDRGCYERQLNLKINDPDFPIMHYSRNDAAARLDSLQGELVSHHQLESELETSLKRLALTEADLSDLQHQFRELRDQKNIQDVLLIKVSQKLAAISKDYQLGQAEQGEEPKS